MSNIQQAIQRAASRFALEVVNILRAATLADIAALTGKNAELFSIVAAPVRGTRGGRRAARVSASSAGRSGGRRRRRGGHKRTGEEVARLADRVTDYLKTVKQEVAVSTIAEALKVPTTDLALPISQLRQAGRVKIRGQKRSTVYRLA